MIGRADPSSQHRLDPNRNSICRYTDRQMTASISRFQTQQRKATMKKTPPITLATTNSKPLRSFGNRRPHLTLASNCSMPEATTDSPGPPQPGKRIAVLQVLLSAERIFLRTLQEAVEEQSKNERELERLKQSVNNEDVFQVARFFFLLEESNCSTPEAVEELLESHNRRLQELKDRQDYQFGSASVLERAHFDDTQISTCIRTIRQKGRPTFSKNELASLLFEQMKRNKATRTIDLMVEAKLLNEESAGDRVRQGKLRSSNRSYIRSDGIVENAVAKYLESVRLGMGQI